MTGPRLRTYPRGWEGGSPLGPIVAHGGGYPILIHTRFRDLVYYMVLHTCPKCRKRQHQDEFRRANNPERFTNQCKTCRDRNTGRHTPTFQEYRDAKAAARAGKLFCTKCHTYQPPEAFKGEDGGVRAHCTLCREKLRTRYARGRHAAVSTG